MTRFRFAAAVVMVVAAAAVAPAQPVPTAPPAVEFKKFGSSPEQFFQSSVTRWTGQLSLDLEKLKAELAAANLPPVQQAAINLQVDKVALQNTQLDQLVRRSPEKDKLRAQFAEVEKAFNQLVVTLNQNPAAKQAALASLTRADGACQQLSAALGGEVEPARFKRRLIRLGESIDDAADELRNTCADQITDNERPIDRALGAYAREARAFSRRVRDDSGEELLKKTYGAMAERWVEVAGLLTRVRPLPPAVQTQAIRLDGLHRRLSTVLKLPPYPTGATPPALIPTGKQFAFAVGAGAGAQPRVTVFADESGTVAYNFFAYDVNFDGGARVDMADLNGDGVPDLIVAPGQASTPVSLPVRVYDGRDLNLLVEFVPFAGWKGGLYVAGTNLTSNRRALLAVTAEGTQHVKIFDLAKGKEVESFFAHDQKVTGGVRIAFGDWNGDGVPDLFTVNGPGNAVTRVKIFSGKNREVLAEFPVVDDKYRNGAFIAAADVTGNGLANAVVGLDAGTVPLARIFDQKGQMRAEWLAYDQNFRGGVRVAVSASGHVVTGPGPGLKNSPVRIFRTGRLKDPPMELVPFIGFDGGMNVGGR